MEEGTKEHGKVKCQHPAVQDGHAGVYTATTTAQNFRYGAPSCFSLLIADCRQPQRGQRVGHVDEDVKVGVESGGLQLHGIVAASHRLCDGP
jgi:hypothetical protein